MSDILPTRTRAPECLSDFTLDSWLSGELAAPVVLACERHLETCERCQARRERLAAERDAYVLAQPAWAFAVAQPAEQKSAEPKPSELKRHGPKRAVRWATRLVPALAAAAALALSFLPREPEGSGERAKGGERIGFMVKHGATVRRGQALDVVHPGDQLRFVYSCPEPRYLAVVSLDAKGHVSTYFPEGPRAARVAPGTDRPLPSAVELDDTLGLEKVVAWFCREPIEIAPLIEEAKRGRLDERPSCTRQEISFRKEAR